MSWQYCSFKSVLRIVKIVTLTTEIFSLKIGTDNKNVNATADWYIAVLAGILGKKETINHSLS